MQLFILRRIVVALPALLASVAASAQTSEPVRSANCLVQIVPNFDVGPGSEDVVFELLQIDAVAREAVREVTGSIVNQIPPLDCALVLERTASDDPLLVKLSFDPNFNPDVPIPADRFLVAACRRLGVVLEKLNRASETKLQADLGAAELEIAQSRAALEEVEAKRRALQERTGIDDLDHDRILNRARSIEDTLQQLELESVSKRAAATAIETRLAEISKRAASAADDEIAAELLRVVDIRGQELAQSEKLRASNSIGDAELREARERFATAKVELLRHRRENQREFGGEFLRELTQQLAENSAAVAEISARAEHLSSAMTKIREKRLLEAAREFENSIAFDSHAAAERLNAAVERLHVIRERLSNLRKPAINIIDGEPPGSRDGSTKN